ncbi:hypothetical protein [Helicobacter pylori]|uniref:hypothetical protein n=1 Tax=Helicobacter pylori TaxID=210 RepID=UPI0039854947
MISFKEALKIHSNIPLKPLEIEVISLFESIRRILAEDIICIHALPKFNQSAMDSF